MAEAERSTALSSVVNRRAQAHARHPARNLHAESRDRLAAFPTFEEASRPLAALVGLSSPKELFHEVYSLRKIGLARSMHGLKNKPQTLHMIFRGHPGTGKTTVARRFGTCFQKIGLLSQGHFTEVERADLVGEYVGHTAQKTREVLRRAQGGVLFIDEAYSLMRGGERDFGREAIDALVRGMEEARDDLVLIFAGYPEEMGRFIKANPGLQSRVAIDLEFPDYTADELMAIAETLLRQSDYRLAPDARHFLHSALQRRCEGGGPERGNARHIRNLVERGIRRQAARLEGVAHPSREQLMTLTWGDLSASGVL